MNHTVAFDGVWLRTGRARRVERFTDLPVNRYVTIVEGKGRIEL